MNHKNHFRKAALGGMLLFTVGAWAGTPVKITGTVKDTNGEPLIGATVAIPGSSTGAVTDIDGNFTLTVDPDKELTVSYVGYTSKKVRPGNDRMLTIVLNTDQQTLSDVVVVGYGTMEKKRVTSSITSIKGDDLVAGLGGSTIATALQGKVSGLTISGSSSPNSSNGYQLRGVSSINAGQGPLVVIDGVPGGDDQGARKTYSPLTC